MPLDGVLTDMIYVPGELFSVNPLTTENVPGLFARNERVVCVFESTSEKFDLVHGVPHDKSLITLMAQSEITNKRNVRRQANSPHVIEAHGLCSNASSRAHSGVRPNSPFKHGFSRRCVPTPHVTEHSVHCVHCRPTFKTVRNTPT